MKPRTNTRAPRSEQAPLTYHRPLATMSRPEARTWIQGMRERLQAKLQRERAYLDRRAARGTHTPTDDAYEADQTLEMELLLLLDDLQEGLAEEI